MEGSGRRRRRREVQKNEEGESNAFAYMNAEGRICSIAVIGGAESRR